MQCNHCWQEVAPGTFHMASATGCKAVKFEALIPGDRPTYCDGCGYCQEHCECGPNGGPSPCSGKIVGHCKKCSTTTPLVRPVSHTAPQPSSIPNNRRPVTELVIEDLNERMAHGIQKYKTALQPFNGRNALIDAYQECLDQALYLKQRLIEEEEKRHQIITIEHHYVNGKGNHVRVCTCGWAARFDSLDVIDEICQRHMKLVHRV